MLSIKELEFLKSTIDKEISIREKLVKKLEADKGNNIKINDKHMNMVIKKHKETLESYINVFQKLSSIGGY